MGRIAPLSIPPIVWGEAVGRLLKTIQFITGGLIGLLLTLAVLSFGHAMGINTPLSNILLGISFWIAFGLVVVTVERVRYRRKH